MTRVDFHILPANGKVDADRWVCKLTAKAWKQGHRVYIQAASENQARRLDDLLWTFRDISFLPHAHSGDKSDDVSVYIGMNDVPPEEHQVLINLAHPVPLFFSRFERVLEIVPVEDSARSQSRERFRFYQERGYPLASHNIESDED